VVTLMPKLCYTLECSQHNQSYNLYKVMREVHTPNLLF
jgi:hypothetical protein